MLRVRLSHVRTRKEESKNSMVFASFVNQKSVNRDG